MTAVLGLLAADGRTISDGQRNVWEEWGLRTRTGVLIAVRDNPGPLAEVQSRLSGATVERRAVIKTAHSDGSTTVHTTAWEVPAPRHGDSPTTVY